MCLQPFTDTHFHIPVTTDSAISQVLLPWPNKIKVQWGKSQLVGEWSTNSQGNNSYLQICALWGCTVLHLTFHNRCPQVFLSIASRNCHRKLQEASAMADGINSTWMTPSASQNMKTIIFPSDWHTLNFFTLADAQCFHCIPASLMFYQVKWCKQVSLAVNMDSRNSHPSFKHWRCGRGTEKKAPNSDFYALLSHIWYTNVHAFCDIHALHGHGAYNCDRKLQCSRYTIFFGLQMMHAIAFSTSIYTVLVLLQA